MAKAKAKQKLKVYRTPIGFHDAFIAAPSQKAALEAWGANTNLFSQGVAEIVTDPKLAKVPLEHPGQVVKVLRGNEAEQLAALAKQAPPRRRDAPEAEVLPKKAKTPKKAAKKPSRSALDRAEAALQKLNKRHAGQLEAIDRERRELQRRQKRERGEAEERLEKEREEYETALRRYESG